MHRPFRHPAAFALALLLVSGGVVLASDDPPAESGEHADRIGGELKNEFVVFLGATSEKDHSTEFTIGLE